MLADVFENFRNKCLEIYEFDPAHFLSAPGLSWQVCLKKTGVILELLTNNGMSVMAKKGIKGGICHAIYRYAKVNNKYLKTYNKNIYLSYLMYLDVNNLYGWAMFQKLRANGFKWKNNVSKLNEEFIKNYDEDSDKGYIFEVYAEYPKDLHNLQSNLLFLSETMKIKKCNKLVCNLYDKKDTRALKQAFNHGLILKKVHRVIQFNQEAWLNRYNWMNTKLRTEVKKKIFSN